MREGRAVVRVEVDAEILNFLVQKARWITEAEALDSVKVGEAIARGLKVSARA
jgi:hypothetical protein